ncbi:hypothetical protein PE36_03114 [Moritella sp. PE36]|uniref:type I polyketide synthase n=1 Tax=Moritella sp. PE36 TaxID=58051 RepID=UPI00015699D1|nr:type I polyketide synthase [Moritella sp. PE36]EDM66669.1 hypothetical protein PE36_03114 [Moritella sp. PE36]
MNSTKVAVIGLAGVFPGASNIDEFWELLLQGKNGIKTYQKDELCKDAHDLLVRYGERYVTRKGHLDEPFMFDYRFFGMAKKDAQLLDPQQRKFLQVCSNALEDSGYSALSMDNRQVGVYASCSPSDYAQTVAKDMDMSDWQQSMAVASNNLRDLVATRVANALNLHGPAINVQTACSSSMAALHEAWRGLLFGDCDMAIAGGVAIRLPQETGYVYHEQGIYSKDGFCRPFSEYSSGTVSGNGAGAVVLKRLDDAIADGNRIYAVVDSILANNDGNRKVGFTAPSVEGQRTLFSDALSFAGINADKLSYVEAHGTATPLGDPIEFTALSQAIKGHTNREHFCHLGSVKANIGHLDSAAGIAGFIKTCLVLWHKVIPPQPDFSSPNPELNYDGSPFKIEATLTPLNNKEAHVAAVNSVGIGGTNVVAILTDWTRTKVTKNHGRFYFPFSVNDRNVLRMNQKEVGSFIVRSTYPAKSLAVHMEKQLSSLPFKTGVWVEWKDNDETEIYNGPCINNNQDKTALVFPGGGIFFAGALLGLKKELPDIFEQWQSFVKSTQTTFLSNRVIRYLTSTENYEENFGENLNENFLTTFYLNHAFMMAMNYLNLKADAVIGHSLGEYNCAVYAGVMSAEDAVIIIEERARLISKADPRLLFNVICEHEKLVELDIVDFEIATHNSARSHTVTIKPEHEYSFIRSLNKLNIGYKKINIKAAVHSRELEPILPEFNHFLSKFHFKPLLVPMASNLNGNLLPINSLLDKDYWTSHLRQPMQYSKACKSLRDSGVGTYFQVGAGDGLAKLAANGEEANVLSLSGNNAKNTTEALLETVAACYHLGETPNFGGLPDLCLKLEASMPLPAYQFKKTECKPEEITEVFDIQAGSVPQLYSETMQHVDSVRMTVHQPERALSVDDWLKSLSLKRECNSLFIDVTHSDWSNIDFVILLKEKLLLLADLGSTSCVGLVIRAQYSRSCLPVSYIRNFAVCFNQEVSMLRISVIVIEPNSTEDYDALIGLIEEQPDTYLLSASQVLKPAYFKRDFSFGQKISLNDDATCSPILILGGTGLVGLNLISDLLQLSHRRMIIVGREGMGGRSLSELLSHKAKQHQLDDIRLARLQANLVRLSYLDCELSMVDAGNRVSEFILAQGNEKLYAILALTANSYDTSIRKPLVDVTYDDLRCQMNAKEGVIKTIEYLEHTLQPDRTLLFSSNASRLGGMGMFSYSVANGFWDAWAGQNKFQKSRLAINFDAFRFQDHLPVPLNYIQGDKLVKLTAYLLNSSLQGSLILSNQDFEQRIREWVYEYGTDSTLPFSLPLSFSQVDSPTTFVRSQWSALLGEEELDHHSHFYALGGHSLMAFRLFASLRQAFGIELVLLDLVQHPTLKRFTDLIEQKVNTPIKPQVKVEKNHEVSVEQLLELT